MFCHHDTVKGNGCTVKGTCGTGEETAACRDVPGCPCKGELRKEPCGDRKRRGGVPVQGMSGAGAHFFLPRAHPLSLLPAVADVPAGDCGPEARYPWYGAGGWYPHGFLGP